MGLRTIDTIKQGDPCPQRAFWVCLALLLSAPAAYSQLPSYTGGVQGSPAYHDGKLRWAVGVQNVQVARSTPDNPAANDGNTTVFRHHPMIAYWGGRFWVMNNGQGNFLSWSDDGLTWSPTSRTNFSSTGSHFRMAFYAAANGRLLGMNYWGDCNGCAGVHLVREIYGPNSLGPVYNIKTNYLGPGPGAGLPYYTTSADTGFKVACDALRNDRLFRQQWQEEDKEPGFYTINDLGGDTDCRAFNWYRRPDNRIVGLWKDNYMTVSTGSTWDPGLVPSASVSSSFRWHTGAKIWGQRTEDGRYAMVGCANNNAATRNRWPLAVTTSSDGETFNTAYLAVAGDISPERYETTSVYDDKNAGPQYVRGISPGNGDPAGSDMWLVYSMNKEDIWVARVSTPITGTVTNEVYDDFQGLAPGSYVPGWNTYSAQWAPVLIGQEQNNRFIQLKDEDNYDYASVTRVFPKHNNGRLIFQVKAQDAGAPVPLEIDVVSSAGDRAVCLALDPASGQITAYNGATKQNVGAYPIRGWTSFEIVLKGSGLKQYDLIVDGIKVLASAGFKETADADVERITFRTGAFRLRDFTRRPADPGELGQELTNRLANADVKAALSRYDIDNVALVTKSIVLVSPAIGSQPVSLTNNAGTEAVFTVNASGHGLSYEWRKGASGLTNGGNVSGAKAATLRLTGVSQVDAGSYSVVVSNAVGPALTSTAASLTVIDLPAAPAGLTALASNSLVQLTWSAVPGATGYNVQRSTTNGGPYTLVGTTVATNYNDTAVLNGFTYYYVVTALNSAGDSLPSGQVQAIPPMEDFRTNPAARGWTAINNPTSGGNNLGWSSGTASVLGAGNAGEMGGIFARSLAIRYYAQTNLGGALSRTNTFSFSGSSRLANEDFNGSLFIGFLDRNDTSTPIPMYGIEFNEPTTGGSLGPFRAQPKIRKGNGSSVVSANISVAQNSTFTFSVTWTGSANGSGTLSGNVAGTPFSISDGPFTESFNAFGVGVGFSGNDDATQNTAGVYFDNLSYSLVPPRIVTPPSGRTNNAGTTAAFTVSATGLSLNYQWRKAAQDLADGGNISGATTPTLTLTNVSQADAASYSVEVRNVSGTATSAAAALIVIDPPPTPPTLWFEAVPAGSITLHWSGTGFVLQQNSDLSNAGGWVNAPTGTNMPAVVPLGGSNLFYRLKWPE